MLDSGLHKELTSPSSPLSDMSSTSPHYMSSHPPDAYGTPYDPYTSHQVLNPINGGKSGPKETYHQPSYTYTTGTSTYRRPWWMMGFEKKQTVGLFVFFGGAILGFSLSRTAMLSFHRLLKLTTAGEGYWYEKAPSKANIIIHIWTSLPASFFSVFLFLPITWNRWARFHGIFGYILSLLLAISLICGAIVGRRGQGGDLNIQAGVYMLASASAYSVVMGCLAARRGAIDVHREYMLRAWFYNGTFVTTRVTALLSAQVITAVNGYYSLWKCAEVGYVLKTVDALVRAYPECGTPIALQKPTWVHVAVHSSWNEGKLGKASASRASFGMALWVAMILHMVGIELYLRYTLDEGRQWREWSERKANGQDQTELPNRMPRYEDRLLVHPRPLNPFNS
ncbi:transmembrane protein, putative [Rhizoctonia solani AG-3 Rhs1AP]|uniref:Transmembrane protein, putative n=1 Tax=Rhizoctonia solani AG-3 Rhs1AP TaxID=1086054 RepID=X8J4Y0_9AGAM|nr:transmembrane protein, putative [Rhizoctonia solani AG-3 Rhs1AP]